MDPTGPSAGIRPFWTCTYEDIVTLDTTLQAIRERALDRIDQDELEADAIGLDGVTTNKHLRKIKQIHDLAREEIEFLPETRGTPTRSSR